MTVQIAKEENQITNGGIRDFLSLFFPALLMSFSSYFALFIEKIFLGRFSTEAMEISISANYDQVASRVHTSTIGRVAGYGIGALIIFPLVIPAVIDGIKSSEANQALDLDFSLKAARDELIYPGFSLNKLLFIPREGYRSPLIFNLMEIESKSLEEFEIHTN